MSISLELSRIQSDKSTIRNKLVELGMATSVDNLDTLATAIEGIVNQGAVSATVTEGSTYTIPAGYHNGAGTVSGISGGGNYTLQSKTVTPTKSSRPITADSGYYGLSDVTVEAIPDAYQDVTSVTSVAADVLTGKVFVAADGTIVTGTMANNGTVNKTLDVTTISYTIPKGYHSGTGTVKITIDTQTVTPTKSKQTITPATGKVLSSVIVNPIPDKYQDITGVTATAADVLTGKKIVDSTGALIDGGLVNNGSVSATINGLTNTAATIPAGYTTGGTISLTNDIEEALAAI